MICKHFLELIIKSHRNYTLLLQLSILFPIQQ